MDRPADRRTSANEAELSPLEHLLAVSSGKPFENLSWRLLKLLIKGVNVEQRVLGKGDMLKVSSKVDAIRIERGSLKLTNATAGWTGPLALAAGITGIPVSAGDASKYNGTAEVMQEGLYRADEDTVARLFFKPVTDGVRKRKGKNAGTAEVQGSRWEWLCARSLVARRALQKAALKSSGRGETVLLESKDLVEYLPALTDLLAQAIVHGSGPEEPSLRVCIVRYDPGFPAKNSSNDLWESRQFGGDYKLDIGTARTFDELKTKIAEGKANHDYVFVDPYDRASDLAAVQVKSLTSRGRVSDVVTNIKGADSKTSGTSQEVPGTTLSSEQFNKELLSDLPTEGIDSIVHVARNFRLAPQRQHKLNFYAVVMDSRTARFEAGGTRDRRQRRSADDPVPPKIDLPDGCDDEDAPTTRLHVNLMRLKKAWEQSPDLFDVCDVLDEPNTPVGGDRRGYWKAMGFFERWVRDLRFRRVGVALGSGGATGFCHVALLRELREQNIPIDLVSGTSFGALVGGYYCSHGLDGLEMLVDQALVLTGVASMTMLTSAFFEYLVNVSIDYRPMWELPIPLYAVATDIERGTAVIFPGPAVSNPSVGFAVRASGALPGLFAPAVAGDARYIDGGAVSNVPVLALIRRGADVAIGSNAFPFRKGADGYKPNPFRGLLPPPFGRLAERIISEINPGNRMADAARGLTLSLSDSMEKETTLASALYEHKLTGVKFWEFHRVARVLSDTVKELETAGALPAAINAVRLLNTPD